jgi:hypothetical protein
VEQTNNMEGVRGSTFQAGARVSEEGWGAKAKRQKNRKRLRIRIGLIPKFKKRVNFDPVALATYVVHSLSLPNTFFKIQPHVLVASVAWRVGSASVA